LFKYSKKQNRDPDDVYSHQLDILESPGKTGKLIKFVVGTLCVVVGVFCVVSYVNPVKEGQVKTTATIVEEQYSSYSGTYHYNVHKGEKSGCKAIIEYDFNGEKYINEYGVDIPKIIENNIDIVINSETGELVETYLYMQQIMYFGIIAIVCGVMILSAIIFRINNLIFLPVVLFIVGAVIFVGYCLNISFANALLSPATAFSFFFISLGLYVYMSFVYISSQFPKNLDEIGKFVIWY
jgi:uncharacterized membrane protein YgdD (TMEM256/DUF423 family)